MTYIDAYEEGSPWRCDSCGEIIGYVARESKLRKLFTPYAIIESGSARCVKCGNFRTYHPGQDFIQSLENRMKKV